jgi:hypothetical protein
MPDVHCPKTQFMARLSWVPMSCVTYFDSQLPFLGALCSSSSSPLRHSSLERLDILTRYTPVWGYRIDDVTWLEILQPFTAVKDLYLDSRSVLHLAPMFRVLTEGRAADVLPALQRIFVQGHGKSEDAKAQGTIGSFIAARQSSEHPVTVHNWE